MADFASPLFSRQALVWYTRLPQDVREEWFQLQTSLLEKWSPPEYDEGVEPTPAAAAPSHPLGLSSKPLEGVIKIIRAISAPVLYLEHKGRNATCTVTENIADALRVRCHRLSDSILLECTDDPDRSWLAVHWTAPQVVIGNGPKQFSEITLIDPKTLKSTWGANYPYRPMTGSVSADMELNLSWKLGDGPVIPLHASISNALFINLVYDPQGNLSTSHRKKIARLFIEPVE
ncbi:hypothetical protein FRB90_002060 [Tulasnella sp. 427]|nr:hypothetical protein FRB90_002060 [Tulasnella sp. 427]